MRDAPRVHLIGLVSGGGVHSSERHLKALVELAAEWGVDDLVVHAFTDGRDTSPTSGAGSLAELEAWMHAVGAGRVGSVVGRYFAMDRDQRWDRIDKAVDAARSRAAASTTRTAARPPRERRTSATRPTSSSRPPRSATRRRSARATP